MASQRYPLSLLKGSAALLFVACCSPACYSIAQAAFTSAITSDGTLGTTVAKAGNVYDINGGTIKGSNQFHSFGLFSVGTGDIASFNGPTSIANILSRVTGGQQSMIDGTLRTTILGANLYLLNPAGVLFGPNASLDLSGSFHVTTADYLRFTDGAGFYADLAQPTVLSVAPVAAFGFLKPNPASIAVQADTSTERPLAVPPAQALSFIGGNITITGSDTVPNTTSDALSASSGRIDLASLGSPGEVILNSPGEPTGFRVIATGNLGDISITDVQLSVAGAPGGIIFIRGNSLTLEDSNFTASTQGNIDHPGTGVDIEVTGKVLLKAGIDDFAEIASSTFGKGDAGDIKVVAGSIELIGNPATGLASNIGSRAFGTTPGAGNAGTIDIRTGSLILRDRAFFQTSTFGPGRGGDILVRTDNMELRAPGSNSFAVISTRSGVTSIASSALVTGDAGNIDVQANRIVLQGGSGDQLNGTGLDSQIRPTARGAPNGGSLRLVTNTLEILDGARISSFVSNGSGRGGNIEITASRILIAGEDRQGVAASINSNSNAPATSSAGDIRLNVDALEISNNGQISSGSSGSGNGGTIEVTAGQVQLASGAVLSASSSGPGNAGNIHITAGDQLISRNSTVTTAADQADGGNIELQVGHLIHLIDSTLSAKVGGGSSTVGGNITVDPDFFIVERSRIIANAFQGQGGNIDMVAGVFLVDPSSVIDASSALGINGTVNIQAPVTNLSGTLAPLPQGFLQAAALLAQRCAARMGGTYSTFVVAGREGLPPEPGGFLPSPQYEAGPAGALAAAPAQKAPGAAELVLERVLVAFHEPLLRPGRIWKPEGSPVALDLGCGS